MRVNLADLARVVLSLINKGATDIKMHTYEQGDVALLLRSEDPQITVRWYRDEKLPELTELTVIPVGKVLEKKAV